MDPLHPWMERLSEYLDGDLAGAERAALEAHLEACDACRTVLEELRAVVVAAGALRDRPPRNDLWPAVAARIGADVPRTAVIDLPARRRGLVRGRPAVPRPLLAAGLALLLLSGAAVWLAVSGGALSPGEPAHAAGDADARFVADQAAPPGYDDAVADLERVLEHGRGRLDPETIRVLEENLRIIEAAIEDARRAVARDPGNLYLHGHLAESMKRKLQLLRRASDAVSAQT